MRAIFYFVVLVDSPIKCTEPIQIFLLGRYLKNTVNKSTQWHGIQPAPPKIL